MINSNRKTISSDRVLINFEPIATAQARDLTSHLINVDQKLNSVVLTDRTGKIPASVLPELAITRVFFAADEAGMLALVAEPGDSCRRLDTSEVFLLAGDPSLLTDWVKLTHSDGVLSVNGKSGTHLSLDVADIPNAVSTSYLSDALISAFVQHAAYPDPHNQYIKKTDIASYAVTKVNGNGPGQITVATGGGGSTKLAATRTSTLAHNVTVGGATTDALLTLLVPAGRVTQAAPLLLEYLFDARIYGISKGGSNYNSWTLQILVNNVVKTSLDAAILQTGGTYYFRFSGHYRMHYNSAYGAYSQGGNFRAYVDNTSLAYYQAAPAYLALDNTIDNTITFKFANLQANMQVQVDTARIMEI